MNKSKKFFPEIRERAVRMVQEHHGGVSVAVGSRGVSITPKIGCVAQMLLEWVTRVEIDSGRSEGLSTAEREYQPRWRRAFDTVYHGSADREKAA